MSALVKGEISDTDLSRNARGGTEQMRDRLLRYVDKSLLQKVVIHFSRVRDENIISGIPNVFYAHDLIGDPESRILANGGFRKFSKLVFVSYWQRDQYMLAYNIPYQHCTVIENAIEKQFEAKSKPTDTINFIYHTTPHRGLQLLYPIFDQLTKIHSNIHLDVFSSFGVYGWAERDRQYETLFNQLRQHKNITYHGARSNDDVLKALDKAHIFLYPCIWQETSCIAMIEAIKSGVLAIHPNLAALPETASECTMMYDYTEDNQVHMNRCFHMANSVIKDIKNNPSYLEKFTHEQKCSLPVNSIEYFTGRWNRLLSDLTSNKM